MELPDEGPDAGEGGMQHGIGRVPPFPRLGGVLARRVGRQRPQQQIGDAEVCRHLLLLYHRSDM